MTLRIDELRKKDYKKAIGYAIKGMHFDWYLKNKFLLNCYGKYFWYLEMNRATEIYSAYYGDKLAGVMLIEMYGEKPQHSSFFEKLYVKFIDYMQKHFFKGGADVYENTTAELLEKYKQNNTPDGEIIFLAADPDIKVKGVGTMLLNEFEQGKSGKTVFLHTDNACTYQFYEKRGFERAEEKSIILDMKTHTVPLDCYLYSKTIK